MTSDTVVQTARTPRRAAIRDQVTATLRGQFAPLRPTTMIDDIYDALCHALRNGSLRPGQPISVRDLAAAFRTSPMPVREAIRRLEAQHVLETTPGRAVSIPGLTAADILEIYTIRVALETLAAGLAATNATPADIRDVRAAYAAMEDSLTDQDYPRFMEGNHAFHMAIYAAAGMPRLVRQIAPHWLRISPFLWSLIGQTHLQFSMDRHRDALTALENRDAAGLKAAIAADILEAQNRLLALLDGAGS
jgi:DNA-binding GntR family transcriptional regulator